MKDKFSGTNDFLYNCAKILIEYAKENKTVYYINLCSQLNYYGYDVSSRNIGDDLGIISEIAVENGYPMLSAIVISKSSSYPGHGFFKLYYELKGKKKDDLIAWSNECSEIFERNDWDEFLELI